MFGSSIEPGDPPPPEYDREHRLDAEIPALIDGLEMPINGATGYTSVELPLWPSNPGEIEEPEESENPEDSEGLEDPGAAQPPAGPEDFPDKPPAEAAPSEPAADEPPGPVQDGSVEPVPDEPLELAPDESVESEPDKFIAFAPELPAEPETPGAQELPSIRPQESPATSPQEILPEPAPSEAQGPETDPAPSEAPEAEPDEETDPYEGAVAVWEPGTAFVILEEDGDWWYVAHDDVAGWIEHRYCMINLPDVIPSIIYDDTNSYASLFVSCGKEIAGVTGEAFYDSLTDNARLGRQEFMMPMLYSAARHICAAQHKALAEGNCLVIYQTFRPYDTQRAVVNAMSRLAKDDPEVKAGVSTAPWSMSWFINTGISNHQRGFALDVSMVKAHATETKYIGSCPYLRITDYEVYKMPTAMHELSIAAISTISPGSSQLSETMNEPAIALRSYFTASGLSPLASEWWHFNDNTAMREAADNPSDGRYFITECLSCLPEGASDLLDFYMMESLEATESPEIE